MVEAEHGCTFEVMGVVVAAAADLMAAKRNFVNVASVVAMAVLRCCRHSKSLRFLHQIRLMAGLVGDSLVVVEEDADAKLDVGVVVKIAGTWCWAVVAVVDVLGFQHYTKPDSGRVVMIVVRRDIDPEIVWAPACRTVRIAAVVPIGSRHRSVIVVCHKHPKEQYFLYNNFR
jgi:hypothetical protein